MAITRRRPSYQGCRLGVDNASDVLGTLCSMGMVGPLVDLEVVEQRISQAALWKHALDRLLDNPLRDALHRHSDNSNRGSVPSYATLLRQMQRLHASRCKDTSRCTYRSWYTSEIDIQKLFNTQQSVLAKQANYQ